MIFPLARMRLAGKEMHVSSRVEHVLEILREVTRECGDVNRVSRAEIKHLRLQAVDRIADRRGIAGATVADAYIRQLRPDVANTADFDRLLEAWLETGSARLQHVLKRHAVDTADEKRIEQFFGQTKSGILATREAAPVDRESAHIPAPSLDQGPSEPASASVRAADPSVEETQQLTGSQRTASRAIETALRFEREQGWMATDVSDGQYGFNVRSLRFSSEGTLEAARYINVKAITSSGEVRVSADEWAKARSFGEDFWLYIVTDAGSAALQLHRIQNPAGQFQLGEDILATGYVIRGDAWRKFAVEE